MEKGGLREENVDKFNTTLLLKWNWIIFKGEKALWLKVLKLSMEIFNML